MFGCNHFWRENGQDVYTNYVVFKFLCNKCGKPKTVIREFGKGFDVEVS